MLESFNGILNLGITWVIMAADRRAIVAGFAVDCRPHGVVWMEY